MVVIGDVNGHVGSDRGGVENIIGAHGIGNRNREGERVIDFCTMNNLSIMNTFYKHRPSHQWTWYRWNDNLQSYNDKSQIDLVITNNKKIFRDVKAIPSVSLDSDHRLVVAKINARKWRVVPGKIRRRFKVEDLKNPEKKESFKEKIRGKVTNLQTGENINEEWEQMKTVVKEVAEEVVEMKYVGKTKKKRTPWWTEEMADAVKEKMKKFRKWMKYRTAENRENYVEARNKCNRVKKESKAEVWQKIGNDLREDMEGTRKLLYNMARNYRKEKNEGAYAEENQMEFLEGENDEITVAEVQAAIQRMKNGKACGEDEIHIEFIKAMGELGANWLTRIMNVAWKNAEISDDWSKAVVCPIFKKDDRTNCNNYRDISLLSHVGKVYERVIERRLRMAVEERFGEWQHGFRPQRSTLDMIFTLKMVLEKNREWNIDKFAIFIDMEKAFDKVPREEIWRALEHQEYDVPANLKRAIKSIYRKCENKVKLRDGDTTWFQVRTGVRQGGVISPLLFIIFMDRCMKEINHGNNTITLAYADDVAVICSSEEELQEMTGRWNKVMNDNGMKININKTEVMSITRIKRNIEIRIGEAQLKQLNGRLSSPVSRHLGTRHVGTGHLGTRHLGTRHLVTKYWMRHLGTA
ncbi:uncharacterized protein LOC143040554 [Oratosquilla oratoria]|uniref:uncharacterized protein LOC143040554 n=1 Tax=Oratosquilla oratoria TaxID=337810 RepID=UPI003F76543E